MTKGEQQAIEDYKNEMRKLIDERKAYQESHKHWTKY